MQAGAGKSRGGTLDRFGHIARTRTRLQKSMSSSESNRRYMERNVAFE